MTTQLLNLLSTNDDFRQLFEKDAASALAQVGYSVGVGEASAAFCMQLREGKRLASKANILRDRAKLENILNVPISFMCAKDFSAH